MHSLGFLTSCLIIICGSVGADGPQIQRVTPDAQQVETYERLTLTIDCEATFTNPFDSRDVSVNAQVTEACGRTWSVPGFWYQPFTRRPEDGAERLEPASPPEWQVRLSFPRPGRHTVTVRVTDGHGEATADPVSIEVIEADRPGMIRHHEVDHRYFVTDRGETYFPVGANVCWGNALGTYSYDEWLARYHDVGCNFFRVWLSACQTTLPNLTFSLNTRHSGYDGIQLYNAWRLDYVLELAESLDMTVLLCIDSFNILRSTARQYGHWEHSPYIETHGGPLSRPIEYFTYPEMRRAYKDRLRYLVGRYGYSASVFAWQLWNEVDIIDEYDSEVVATWHAEMAEALAEMDPWDHLITTSHANPMNDPRVDSLPQLDFVLSHSYGGEDIVARLGQIRDSKAAAHDRPHFQGEFGIHTGGGTSESDPLGIHLHNALFASPGQMQAGGPMSWWWDSYIHPLDLYDRYHAFNTWLDGFDFIAEEARPIQASFDGRPDAENLFVPGETRFVPVHASWNDAPFNQPVTVQVDRDGEINRHGALSRVLHGTGGHPALHNPVTFELDVPADARFGVYVEGVSGHGGAALRITVNGKTVLDTIFDDPEPHNTDTHHQYDGLHEIPFERGQHTILVENPGYDWCFVAYHISWRLPEPALRVLGVQGRQNARIWVQNRQFTWKNANDPDFDIPTVEGAILTVVGLQPGAWTWDQVDTRSGAVSQTGTHTVEEGSPLRLDLPPILHDAAYRLHRAD